MVDIPVPASCCFLHSLRQRAVVAPPVPFPLVKEAWGAWTDKGSLGGPRLTAPVGALVVQGVRGEALNREQAGKHRSPPSVQKVMLRLP